MVHKAIIPLEFWKFLSKGDVCETSTSLAWPIGMRLFEHLHRTKWLCLAQFELNLTLHVSAPSWSSFWTILVSCKATMIYLGPNLLKVTRMKVLLTLNLADKLYGSKTLPVDHQCSPKFTAVNFRGFLPFNQITFNQATTVVETYPAWAYH